MSHVASSYFLSEWTFYVNKQMTSLPDQRFGKGLLTLQRPPLSPPQDYDPRRPGVNRIIITISSGVARNAFFPGSEISGSGRRKSSDEARRS